MSHPDRSQAVPPDADAYVDPWCEVRLSDGSRSLFAFALRHPVTGGLSWLRSSDVVELDAGAGHAVTVSGRRYRLGRRFDLLNMHAEGEEAAVAFDALIGSQVTEGRSLRLPGETDLRWLAACKIARHLEVHPPKRDPAEVRRFLASNLAEYAARRRPAG